MARNLMIQGTMSNAGKSLVTAGILRVMKQDGIHAAPFKSQNMALNSFITRDGLEMGRAQVMQAEAAGVEPDVAMNPILLKPTSDVGSQVIVNGEVLGNYKARDYYKRKASLKPEILNAYHKLEAQYDVIVMEGAGSPAEINLRKDDIVNMGMAEMVDAPVLLVGDIDRGGVFAQLLGTVLLLEQQERERIKGFIINKFRGDPSLLAPAPEILEEKTGIKTLGVLPFVKVSIDDEDSLSSRLTFQKQSKGIYVTVVRLPHISNFTDFNPLENHPQVTVSYVTRPQELEGSDLILLPGTKNTIADLKWLRASGMEAAILKQKRAGVLVGGICGGFQMLGEKIEDPQNLEGGGSIKGMGLLPMTTVFEEEKTRTRKTGTLFVQPELSVWGYEIHMGSSTRKGGTPFSILEDGKEDGCVAEGVFGTYLHGIFEEGDFANHLITYVAKEKGLEDLEGMQHSYQAFKEEQYDILADAVRKNLPMEEIYRIIGV